MSDPNDTESTRVAGAGHVLMKLTAKDLKSIVDTAKDPELRDRAKKALALLEYSTMREMFTRR